MRPPSCLACILWAVSLRATHAQWLDALARLAQRALPLALPPPAGTPRDTPDVAKEYDFVIVGAGSGGSVLANRLSEVPGWTVLLLEAGKDESYLTDIPVLVSYLLSTDYNWGFQTEPQPDDGDGGACLAMEGGRCRWPRGKVLGGTSVINYMVYTKGSAEDFDGWAARGNYGWAYRDVLPYFLKSEDIQVPTLFGSRYHGRGGYLTVQRAAWRSPLVDAFLEGGRALGHPVVDDLDDPETPLGFSRVLANTRNGSRCSAAKAFLRPVRARPNLDIAKGVRVTRVLVERGQRGSAPRAVGVQFVRDRRTRVVRARKEVILCAGTIGSPHLLLLSGIGPAAHLREHAIEVVRDLPVGLNLQDHVAMGGLAFLVNDSVTLVESRLQHPRYALEYLRGTGPMTLPGGAEAVAFLRSPLALAEHPASLRPDLELVFGPGALPGDTGGSIRRSLGLDEDFWSRVYGGVSGRDSWNAVPILLRPRSRGVLRLRSANPFHWPRLYANYFQDPRDLQVLVHGIKTAVRLSETRPFQRFGSAVLRTPFPGCTNHTFASDAYWACTARYFTTSLHHQVGTCKMGPRDDPSAVVDPELRVHGVKALRVVDASVIPDAPSGHPNAVVYMIGEKAADMVKQTWRGGNEDPVVRSPVRQLTPRYATPRHAWWPTSCHQAATTAASAATPCWRSYVPPALRPYLPPRRAVLPHRCTAVRFGGAGAGAGGRGAAWRGVARSCLDGVAAWRRGGVAEQAVFASAHDPSVQRAACLAQPGSNSIRGRSSTPAAPLPRCLAASLPSARRQDARTSRRPYGAARACRGLHDGGLDGGGDGRPERPGRRCDESWRCPTRGCHCVVDHSAARPAGAGADGAVVLLTGNSLHRRRVPPPFRCGVHRLLQVRVGERGQPGVRGPLPQQRLPQAARGALHGRTQGQGRRLPRHRLHQDGRQIHRNGREHHDQGVRAGQRHPDHGHGDHPDVALRQLLLREPVHPRLCPELRRR